jgi:hypothetical protein
VFRALGLGPAKVYHKVQDASHVGDDAPALALGGIEVKVAHAAQLPLGGGLAKHARALAVLRYARADLVHECQRALRRRQTRQSVKRALQMSKTLQEKMKAHALCAVPSYFYYTPYSKLYVETV